MGALHPALYLERINPCVDEVRQDLEDAQIPHGERIFFLSFQKTDPVAVRVKDLIGKAACAGTPAAVSTPSAQKTGQKTAPGIGIAHCAVYKALHFYRSFPLDRPDLLQRQFSCGHHSSHAEFLEKADGFGCCRGQLRRCVKRQSRTSCVQLAHYAQILHDHAVEPFLVKGDGKFHRLLHLALLSEHIKSQVNLAPQDMGFPDRPDDLIFREVLRVCPGAEFLPAQVNRVRTCS